MSEQQPAPTELRFRPVASDGPRSVRFDTSLADAASAGGAHHRMNNWLAVWLVALVAASLIPLASARPVFWMASAVLIALIGMWYALSLLVLREPSRILLRRFWFEAVLFAALCLYLAAQLLPIGRFVPIGFTLSDGTVLSTGMLSLAPGDTWLMLISLVGYGLFFALFLQVAANRRRARRVLVALLAIATAEAIYSLVSLNYLGDTLLGLEKTAYLGFATGTFVNRNSLATFLAAGLTIGAALLFGRPERDDDEPFLPRLARGLAIVAAMAFIAAALFASGSRMGALVGALGVVSVTIIGLIARPRLGGLLWVLALLALGAVGLFVAYGTGLVERMMTLRDASENRGELYRQVWEMIMLRPWLGYGGGSFPIVFPIFEEAPLALDLVWDKAHSTYLALWAELGLVAGSIPVVVVASLCARAMGGLRDPSSLAVSLAAIGCTVVYGAHAVVDFSLEIQANTYVFLAVLALGAATVARTRTAAAPGES